MMDADDPRLTAYALGEADPNERRLVEAAMATDPRVAEEVETLRSLARRLARVLEGQGVEGLTASQRAALLAPPTSLPVTTGRPAWQRWGPFVAGLAAAGLVLGGLVSLWGAGGGGAQAPRRGEAAPVESASGRASEFEQPAAAGDRLAAKRLSDGSKSEAPGGGTAPASSTLSSEPTPGAPRAVPPGLREPRDPGSEAVPGPHLEGGAETGNVLEREEKEARAGATPAAPDAPVVPPSASRLPAPVDGLALPEGTPLPTAAPPATVLHLGGSSPTGPAPAPDVMRPILRPGDELATGARGRPALDAGTPRDSLESLPRPPMSPSPTTPSGDLSGFSLPRAAPPTPSTREVGGPPSGSAEAYEEVAEAPFLRVADAPLSTFSVDVDTASYANVRRMLRQGVRPPAAAVRVEELVNYFRYADPAPTGADPFAVRVEAAACPWNAKHRLVRVALKGRELVRDARPAMNLVFLVDVSGSMNDPNKLPLVQASLRMLLEELHERDTVALVVYAGSSGLVLPPTSCEQKTEIQAAIDRLRAGGSTNGGAGIQLAYDTARSAYLPGGVNRVVLATDGDFNVGVTSKSALLALIEEQAKSRIFLTCLGYGTGNLKDGTLEMLADKGNGNYGYVDSTREARKLLVEDASGTLVTIAKDVKLQVEFNPATVAAYRLLGYDNRRLANRDFTDDTKDAGEVGAGHAVTALYELVPVGVVDPAPRAPEVEPLRYGPHPAPPAAPAPSPPSPAEGVAGETLLVKVRWKAPEGDVSTQREVPFTDGGAEYARASGDFQFAAAVAAFGLVLAESPYRGTATLEAVAELASAGLAFDPGGYRAEFATLVAAARALVPGR